MLDGFCLSGTLRRIYHACSMAGLLRMKPKLNCMSKTEIRILRGFLTEKEAIRVLGWPLFYRMPVRQGPLSAQDGLVFR